jgi:formimidoylglutamate deiminase
MTHLWFETALLPNGWADAVAVDVAADGTIAGVTPNAPPAGTRGGVALPGLCNLHSHAFQRGMAGLAEMRGASDDSFWGWRDTMYRFVDRLNPEQVAAIATLAYVEMLECGFTRVGEFHYLHHDVSGAHYADRAAMAGAIAAAAAATGIGLTLLPVFYAASDFGGAQPAPAQRRFINAVDDYAVLHAASHKAVVGLVDAVVGVAPHSLRAATPEQIAAILPLAKAAPVHIHIAEQAREIDACLAWSGARPVDWLLDHAAVDARWCLVHATHVTPAEVARVAASGAIVGLCPVTEANLGDGIFPAADFVAAGGRYGVGSDSNVRIDAAGELQLLEYGQRLVRQSRNVLATSECPSTGASLFTAAFAGGAQALGVIGPTGLAVGAAADIVSFDGAQPAMVSRAGDALLDGWVFCGARVDSVWRRGKQVVTGGRHIARDEAEAGFAQVLRAVLA